MALRQIISCSSCGNEIKLYEGEKLIENAKCRQCGRPLTIPEEFRVSLYKRDGDISMNLEKKSFENLVSFFKDELKRVTEGERATTVFTEHQRSTLRNAGILSYRKMTWTLSEKAVKYLGARDEVNIRLKGHQGIDFKIA